MPIHHDDGFVVCTADKQFSGIDRLSGGSLWLGDEVAPVAFGLRVLHLTAVAGQFTIQGIVHLGGRLEHGWLVESLKLLRRVMHVVLDAVAVFISDLALKVDVGCWHISRHSHLGELNRRDVVE